MAKDKDNMIYNLGSPEYMKPIVLEVQGEAVKLVSAPAKITFMFHKKVQEGDFHISLDTADVNPEDFDSFMEKYYKLLEKRQTTDFQIRLKTVEGDYHWCQITVIVNKNITEHTFRIFVIIYDIDQMFNANRMLSYQEQHDVLTGYSSLAKYKNDVKQILKHRGNKKYVLYYCDIRNFKYINDLYGYSVGDDLIRYWADILFQEMTEEEAFAHINSDNFSSLCRYNKKHEIYDNYKAIIDKLKQFPVLAERGFGIDLVVGAYCIETDEDVLCVEDMIDRANIAQKSVKYLGGSQFAVYNQKMREQVLREKQIEAQMEHALLNREFQVYFQGQVDIQHEYSISGAEALVRWINKDMGFLSPAEFIPLFEKNGFIIKLDQYVFEEVCRYVKNYYEKENKWIRMSINVSRITMFQPEFLEQYIKVKKSFGIPDKILALECTESIVIKNLEAIEKISEQIRQNGFLFSMDDFGAGESSLNALKDLSVDILKLDRGFFLKSLNRKKDRVIIASIISMAKILKIEVVAEGVEELEQVAFLQDIGCDIVQGYVFFKPIPMESFAGAKPLNFPKDNRPLTPYWTESSAFDTVQGNLLDEQAFAERIPCSFMKCVYNKYFTILYANQSFYDVIGYTQEELKTEKQNRLSELIQGNIDEILENIQNQRKLHKKIEIEFNLKRRDGRYLWIIERIHDNEDGTFCCSTKSVIPLPVSVGEIEASKQAGRTVAGISPH